MKTSLLSLLLVTCIAVFGQRTTNLNFFTDNGERISVYCNGQLQNNTPSDFVSCNDWQGESIMVKIQFQNGREPITRQFPLQPGYEITSVIKRNKNGRWVLERDKVVPLSDTHHTEEAVQVQNGPINLLPNGTMCQNPQVSPRDLITIKYDISQRLPHQRLPFAKDIISQNCWYAAQIADIVRSLSNGTDQLEIGKFGYLHTFDTQNYMVAVEAQKYDYNKTKLINFIGTTNTPYQQTEDVHIDHHNHNDHVNHNQSDPIIVEILEPVFQPMTPDEYNRAKKTLNNQTFKDAKLATSQQIIRNNYLTVNQVIGLSKSFSFEDDKLEFVKAAYSSTLDQNEYYRIVDQFTFSSNKRELNNFLNAQPTGSHDHNHQVVGGPQQLNAPVCLPMNSGEFASAKKAISNQSFSRDMLETTRQVLRNNYVTVAQVRELTTLFSFDDNKLEVLKVAHDKTVDQKNYYQLVNVLTYSANKQAFNTFLNSK